jgi:hypothetical protein
VTAAHRPDRAAHVVASTAELRRQEPRLYREFRRQAFEMRAQLRDELADVDPRVVQDVTLCVLGKVLALTMVLGQDLSAEQAAAAAGSIGSIAVVDELWPGERS